MLIVFDNSIQRNGFSFSCVTFPSRTQVRRSYWLAVYHNFDMTLVVHSSSSTASSGALVVHTSETPEEVPTYRLAREPSFYDKTQSRTWFYNSRALIIQRAWRRQRDLRRFQRQRDLVIRGRQERIAQYYQKRMLRLLHFIDWDGEASSAAAQKIQRAFRKRYFPEQVKAQRQRQLVVVEEQPCYIWERQ